jgi:tyrosinase
MLRKLMIAALALMGGVTPADAQQQNIFITGVPVPRGGAVPARKNINDLEAAGGPQW